MIYEELQNIARIPQPKKKKEFNKSWKTKQYMPNALHRKKSREW